MYMVLKVGGRCEAKNSVEAGYFGSNACPHTIIKVGFDPELTERLKSVKEETEEIKESKKKLEQSTDYLYKLKYNGNGQFPPDKVEILNKLEEVQVSIAKKLHSLEIERDKLLRKKKELEKAYAVGHVGVFPKVQIHIGNQWIRVEDKLGPSEFRIVEGDVFRLSK